jgi:hypothetical protein
MANVWPGFCESYGGLRVGGNCSYYKVYDEDKYIKQQFEILTKKLSEPWISNIPASVYKIHPEACISCKKEEYLPIFSNGKVRRLCYHCLSEKYDELQSIYSIHLTRCLLVDD